MKRILAVLMALLLLLCGCSNSETKTETKYSNQGTLSTGVWLSYMEISNMLTSPNGFSNELNVVIENCKGLYIQNVYIHIRPFCDSIFPSKYFPLRKETVGYDYDIFQYILTAFHNVGIKVHAWINPYRVYTASSDINDLNAESPAYKWLNDEDAENDKNVCFNNGIYLNPAEIQVQQLVIDGIREIIENYDVDGIHFDDYFYPTTDESFDKASYGVYAQDNYKPMSLGDWRRTNVNLLISGCNTVIKNSGKNIVFSISPAASIKKNYDELYADVEYWVENGIVDAVIPQLYFGFEYPLIEYRFENLLYEWKKLMECNAETELIIGLANYKIGTQNSPDNEEWKDNRDIIPRQVEICHHDERVTGVVLYSYSSVFSTAELNKTQMGTLTDYLKTCNGE